MLPRNAVAAGNNTVKAAKDINDPVSCTVAGDFRAGDGVICIQVEGVGIIQPVLNTNNLGLSIKNVRVSTKKMRVGTMKVRVGTMKMRVGTMKMRVGTKKMRVGTKKMRVPKAR